MVVIYTEVVGHAGSIFLFIVIKINKWFTSSLVVFKKFIFHMNGKAKNFYKFTNVQSDYTSLGRCIWFMCPGAGSVGL